MPESQHVDVLILGGGLAGLMQARHLRRTLPELSVAIVEPRSKEEIATIHKIGESTVEMAAHFLTHDLGLIDYMIDNHPPKCGLNFHWPKQVDVTENIEDYWSVWATRFPKIGAFQMHRGKLEHDLTDMCAADGVIMLRGRARTIDLAEAGGKHHVRVKLADKAELDLEADHLIDAAGRAFLLGRKLDNIIKGPENLFGLDTVSSWVRVKGVDRNRFSEGAHPDKTSTSHWYATNHFFGHGHWVWMIPIDRDSSTVSFGLVAHRTEIDPRTVNTQEKLLAFLRANHAILADLIDTGEIEDFICWDRPSHLSKQMFGENNWYVVGDAAYFGDPFYSTGTSTIAVAITSITKIIEARSKGWADAEERRRVYNEANLTFGRTVGIHLFREHPGHMGHPSAMSWRIYLEYMWWFGMWVPMFVGKWHLDLEFARALVAADEKPFFKLMYDRFTKLAKEGGNAGFADAYRADHLKFGYSPTADPEHWLENTELGRQRLDVFATLSRTYRYTALYILTFLYRAWGWRGLMDPPMLGHVGRMLVKSAWVGLGSLRHRVRNWGMPKSVDFDRLQQDFEGVRPLPPVQAWLPEPEPEPPMMKKASGE
jgi:flavin-dependent dehydrogenase